VDIDFVNGLINQLINASSPGKKPDESALNQMIALVGAIEPKDEAECMLAAQMAAFHMATMTFARRLAHVDNILQQDSGRACLRQAGADLRGAVGGVEALQEGRGNSG
jgi:predicted component of type VI protein secretion system